MKTNAVHLLKLEATAELAILLTVFNLSAASWWMLLALFLLPDLSILAYFWGTEAGATAYNLTHTYAVAIGSILALYWISGFLPSPLWLVWPIHIALDRMLGYGLKSPASFHQTHLT